MTDETKVETEVIEPESKEQETEEPKETGFRAFIKNLLEGKEEEPKEKKETQTDPEKKETETAQTTVGDAKPGLTEEAVKQMIADEKQKWEAEREEQERLKKLSPEERKVEEEKNLQSENERLKHQLQEKELKDQAIAKLSKEGYPVQLAELLQYGDQAKMEKSLETATSILKSCVEAAVKDKLRGTTPKGLGSTKKTENDLSDKIAKAIKG